MENKDNRPPTNTIKATSRKLHYNFLLPSWSVQSTKAWENRQIPCKSYKEINKQRQRKAGKPDPHLFLISNASNNKNFLISGSREESSHHDMPPNDHFLNNFSFSFQPHLKRLAEPHKHLPSLISYLTILMMSSNTRLNPKGSYIIYSISYTIPQHHLPAN